ncbi:reverse transcriptase domain-containing protein [Geothermobacter hydrogeniphilus]|uniref:reverse transcriptase domain-containing protein n=1 Tax=Geothermobacter hydrogeniphilus TaxID=1969733 RepID=UPI001E585952|nr:reverse transcriptase domain-containing protein [Geothermobacter hydrogeniphilus]
MLTTPEKIRTLQRKLYRKAKQDSACRFHTLYDKVYRADILSHAYALVRANKGSAGIDGVTIVAIEREGVAAFIAELEDALRNKTYKPDPVKRVMIPKSDGGQRPLGIPTIRDRVAQMALKLVIEPIFEADFCDTSYGFRPKKSAHAAVDDVTYSMSTATDKPNLKLPRPALYSTRNLRNLKTCSSVKGPAMFLPGNKESLVRRICG